MDYEKIVNMLGKKAKDIITGSTGVITSLSFDLYGCIQVILTPGKIDKEFKEVKSIGWVDINRIKIIKNKRIMEHPDFNNKYKSVKQIQGPVEKPII